MNPFATADHTACSIALIGFKKYVSNMKRRAAGRLKVHLITFAVAFLFGVLLEYLLYGAFPGVLPAWVRAVLDIVACVCVWQFAAYMAFEFAGEVKKLRRFDQIHNAEYSFQHWE